MRALRVLRSRLGWKLLISYLVVVLVGIVVLAGTAELLSPSALARHIARMEAVSQGDTDLAADLYRTFNAAVTEILTVAGVAAVVAAVLVGLFTTRRIVRPIEAMARASRRIASGDYRQRVDVQGEDELGNLGRAFNRMAATLEQTEQRRLMLIGDVAHELRTPLGNIRSVAEGLIDGVLPAEPATYQRIQAETARMQRLVRDLQELSRAEAGQITLERQSVPPAQLIEGAAERLATQYESKDVGLALDVPADLPAVQADPGRMTQVLTNLLGNALQYTPSGGQVTVRAARADGELTIAVHDTGIGLPAGEETRVFERFYRVDKSRARSGGGSGIGLAIARHLVEAHGGRIWAESVGPGRGSTFAFTLPVAAGNRDQDRR